VGNIGVPIGLPKDHKVKVNSHFAKVYDKPVPFGRVQGNFVGVYKATERYYHPDITVEDYGKERFRSVFNVMKQIYRPFKGVCRPVDFLDTQFNPDSSLGYVVKQEMKRQYKLKNTPRLVRKKDQLYPLTPRLIVWMKEWGWRFQIPVLWETSGKCEILKQKKVDAGDIRTFTFGDPFYTLNYSHLISGVKICMKLFANSFGKTSSRMGVSFTHGSFTEMCEQLRHMICVKGDCMKWDSNYVEVLAMASYHLCLYLMGCSPNEPMGKELFYYVQQAHHSYVRMPGGQVLKILFKVSGDPWTTGGNCMGHEFILVDHLMEITALFNEENGTHHTPYQMYRKCAWNIYADDHLNGYPPILEQYLSYETRAEAYGRVGQKLHPPPNDEVQFGPLGLMFLGAEVVERDGYFVPRYDFNRLLAILYCNEYSPKELEEVIVSISPLVATNEKAQEVLIKYVSQYYPWLIPYLEDIKCVFSGEEAVGIKIDRDYPKIKEQALLTEEEKRQMNGNSNSMGSKLNNTLNNPAGYDGQLAVNPRRTRKRSRNTIRRANAGSGQRDPVLTRDAVRHLNTASRELQLSNAARPNSRGGSGSTMRTGVPRPLPRRGFSKTNKSEIRTIVAGFLNPRDNCNILPTSGEEVGIYNSKIASINITGANDTTSPPLLATADYGKFSVFVSPTITNKSGFANTPNTRLIVVDGGDRNVVYPAGGLTTTVFNSRINFYPDPNQNVYTNTDQKGTADEMACTGMSLLLTYDGDLIRGGGQIASHCMPAGSYFKRAITTNVNPGNAAISITNYDVLNDSIPKSYNGPLVEGTYVWWCPDSIDDLSPKAVQSSSAPTYQTWDTYSPPYLVAAGVITQGTTGQSSLMLTTYANYNYTRNDRTQPGFSTKATRSDLEMALEFLQHCPKAMPNAFHIAAIPALLGALAGFLTTGDAKGAILGAIKSTGVQGVK